MYRQYIGPQGMGKCIKQLERKVKSWTTWTHKTSPGCGNLVVAPSHTTYGETPVCAPQTIAKRAISIKICLANLTLNLRQAVVSQQLSIAATASLTVITPCFFTFGGVEGLAVNCSSIIYTFNSNWTYTILVWLSRTPVANLYMWTSIGSSSWMANSGTILHASSMTCIIFLL